MYSSVSLSFEMINWLKLGYQLATLLISGSITLAFGALVFRKYVLPELLEALETAQTTITNLAKLSGVKSQEFTAGKSIEKAVARDIITEKVPELEALKVFVSEKTWEEIEDTIDNNPEAILQLWQKYGHLLGQTDAAKLAETDF